MSAHDWRQLFAAYLLVVGSWHAQSAFHPSGTTRRGMMVYSLASLFLATVMVWIALAVLLP